MTLDPARPKVSVLMITYNHEAYIEEAVRSVMMQRVDFPIELVISDDASKDATPDILRRLQAEFPETIRLTLREQNIGMLPNFVETYFACRGDYIALLEGDDYWIDPDKLAFQVDFFQTHPDYVLIGTNAHIYHQTQQVMTGLRMTETEAYDFDTALLMERYPIPTCTAMLKNGLIDAFPSIYLNGYEGDHRLYLLLSQYGRCRYDPRVTGVYRMHDKSVTSLQRKSLVVRKQGLIKQVEKHRQWNEYFGGRYQDQVDALTHDLAFRIVRLSVYTSDLKTALTWTPYVQKRDFKNPLSHVVIGMLRAGRWLGDRVKTLAVFMKRLGVSSQ